MNDSEEPGSSQEGVKSKSLIKFESSIPKQFAILQAAVDLKRPPSNWLNGQIKFTPSKMSSSTYKFTSFRMAFDFWHELGDVDVISDSENIKNLLKTPYSDSNNVLSYFVHRVGNTLLIDDFDLHKYLLWKSEEDWQWLRQFIYENVLSRLKEKDRKPIPLQNRSREFLEQKNLLSKFLYYSIEDSKKIEEKEYVPMKLSQPMLPQPKREDISDSRDHKFSRNVLWTFEDIRMLIGSDMQIFGNQSRPCISLRLRDMKKPINVLTGIDYWLDNLMCNVPEIFLCFHQDGIVQKYEVIKTEDLPSLENSKFSPKVIRNVAQNILSFLKANATKSGHTYWLFKAKNDDVVKLYDLTTLQLLATTAKDDGATEVETGEKKEENDQNPFTIPVAMLFYTVARNMKYSNEKMTAKQAGNIKQLLDNCLKLLPRDKYPQIVTSSHYILSDIQIQAGIDPVSPSMPFNDDESDSDENSDELYEGQTSDEDVEFKDDGECYSAVQSIQDAMKESIGDKSKISSRPLPLVLGTVKERCAQALENVISGLQCLQFFDSESSMSFEKQKEKEQIIEEEQNPKLANPDVAIPMGWSKQETDVTRKSKKKAKKGEQQTEAGTSNEVHLDSKLLLMKGAPNVKTWNIHLKVLLFEKASLTYACLGEDCYAEKKFGEALRHLKMSIMCQSLVTKYVPGMPTQRSCLFGRAGDCYFQISKSLESTQSFIDGFNNFNDQDHEILNELNKEEVEKDDLHTPSSNMEEMLEASCDCYELSLVDNKESKFELVRRLGNVYNELGVCLMHRSHRIYNLKFSDEETSQTVDEESYQQPAKKSYEFLMKAVTLFERVEDKVNLIICNLNLGRFFRLSAHISTQQDAQASKSFQMQKKIYQDSFNSYHYALTILENRKNNPELWDLVTWELSTATFSLAKQMQDNGLIEGNAEEIERDVIEMLMKALKLCDLETNSSRQVLYCFRAGLIHRRLGSLYHQSLRSTVDDIKKRATLQISRLHYEKAANLLESLKEFKDYFQVQLERIALQEYLSEEATNAQLKIKNYQLALALLMEARKMLQHLVEAKTVMELEQLHVLLDFFEQRLQHILKNLTKILMSSKKVDPKAEVYKKMFACTLRSSKKMEVQEHARHLISVLDKVKNLETI